MAGNVTIDDLAFANRPPQFALMERIARTLTMSDVVTHLLVRGSLATGTADRMSDVDFVIGVKDTEFARFIRTLDSLMAVELGTILPGWRDTIVSRMGGLGFVYLLVSDGRLYQVDIYAIPESLVPSIRGRMNTRPLYGSGPTGQEGPAQPDASIVDFVEAALRRPPTCSDVLTEILVLIQMMQKRIKRGEHFVLYSETCLLLNAVKELIKTALAPTSAYWGWYHLHDEVGVTAVGRWCLSELVALIDAPPIRSTRALGNTFQRIEGIAGQAAPESLAVLGPAIEAYKHYVEFG